MDTFAFTEIKNFDLEDYSAFRGWLGARLLKIYRDDSAGSFYLHDETTGRLFAFSGDAASLKTDRGYESLVADYLVWRDGQ